MSITTVDVPLMLVPVNWREAGWKLHVAFSGRPEQESSMAPLYPGTTAMVKASVALPVCETLNDELAAETANSATAVEEDDVKFMSPKY